MSVQGLAAMMLATALAHTTAAAERPLRIYCVYHAAHGLRAVARDYGKRTGVRLGFRLHCREHFTPTAQSLKDGDLFLTTSPEHFAKAKEAGLLASGPTRIGRVVPIIAVRKGNPHGIHSLADLGRNGLVVAYPSTCIGNVALNLVVKNHLSKAVKPNLTIRTGNRTGVLRPLVQGKAQAALTWSCAIIESGRKDIDMVPIPEARNVIDPVLVAALKSSRSTSQAKAFIDYLATQPVKKRLAGFRLRDEPREAAR